MSKKAFNLLSLQLDMNLERMQVNVLRDFFCMFTPSPIYPTYEMGKTVCLYIKVMHDCGERH